MHNTCQNNGTVMAEVPPSSSEMRQRAEWMSDDDDSILEMFRDWGNLSPVALSREGHVARLDIGAQHASNRCRELWRRGMLMQVDRGLYRLTCNGAKYLDEDFDAADAGESEKGPVAGVSPDTGDD